jgi:hypothetical protein
MGTAEDLAVQEFDEAVRRGVLAALSLLGEDAASRGGSVLVPVRLRVAVTAPDAPARYILISTEVAARGTTGRSAATLEVRATRDGR